VEIVTCGDIIGSSTLLMHSAKMTMYVDMVLGGSPLLEAQCGNGYQWWWFLIFKHNIAKILCGTVV
jgi:hypothetical protein